MGESPEDIAANSRGSEVSGLHSCQAHHVGISTTEDRGGTKGTVGESSEELAANNCGGENSGLGSCQTQNISSRQEENCGGCPRTLGGVPNGEEESGLVALGACCGGFAVGFPAKSPISYGKTLSTFRTTVSNFSDRTVPHFFPRVYDHLHVVDEASTVTA
jgi:hypothetical protein